MLSILAAFAAQAAVVYKWTDSNGLVHYSDQPAPGAEKIFTAGSPTAGGGNSGNASSAGRASTSAAKSTAPGPAFTQFVITSPTADQTFFGDDVIGVHLALNPDLKPSQSITWHLNGREIEGQVPTAVQFILPHLDRGAYVIAATVTDQETGESVSTDSISFFVRQPSELSPLHKRP